MAKKSKQSDLGTPNKAPSPPSTPTPGRQPRIVGWLVIIVGCISTWYWYKPLPDSVQQTVNSTNANSWLTSDSGPKSLWSDQGLVVPGTSGVFENPIEFQAGTNAQPAEANLVGTPKVTLVPWSETQHDIREVLKTERQQASASHRQESIALSEPPRPLIPAANPAIGPLETSVAKPSWPDEGYVPPPKAKRRNQAQITAPIPPFLETGMKSIRTTESDDVPGPKGTIAPNTEPQSAPAPIRQPQFIRQPKR